MEIRKYHKEADEHALMEMIGDEDGWSYTEDKIALRYKESLQACITYVAYCNDELCGYCRAIDDFGSYIYICDLLVIPSHRGKHIGKQLMEAIAKDHPNHVVYVMSDEDGYYKKVGYKKVGSIFQVSG